MERQLSTVLERLRLEIAAANQVGNIEGLFARVILGDDARLGFRWRVDCDREWLKTQYDPTQLPRVSALGYTAASKQLQSVRKELEDGLLRACARDAALVAEGVPVQNPTILVGLLLGAELIESRHPECMAWCVSVVKHLLQTHQGAHSPLLAHCAQVAGLEGVSADASESQPLLSAAAADWFFDNEGNGHLASDDQRHRLRHSIVLRELTEETGALPAHQAALLWRALQQAASAETSALMRTPHTVVYVLEQFESSLHRWRWDSDELKTPVRWPILSEREVQDVLWVMLRSTFLDLLDEDTLPKFGHSTYRADFGIPSLGVLIEVKFAREAGDFKKVEKEVLEDVVPYLKTPERYREIVVFIYDDSASVQEHELAQRALSSVPGIAGVVIASRPSQLPPGPTQSAAYKCA
jgi:hypothetical protein